MTTIEPLTASSPPIPGYTVGVVAQRLGVPTATLRSWSQRYGLGPHGHTRGRHRLYSESDIAQLTQMVGMVQAGASPASAAAVVKARLVVPEVLAGSAQLVALAEQLDTAAMSEALDRSIAVHGVLRTWDDLCRPAFAELVDRQVSGACIDAEHALSWVVSGSLRSVVQRSAAVHGNRGLRGAEIVLACTPGERHLLALDALAAALAEAGVAVRMLGSDVPLSALRDALGRLRPRTVVLWSQAQSTANIEAVEIGQSLAGQVCVGGQGWAAVGLPDGVQLLTGLEQARDALTFVTIGPS